MAPGASVNTEVVARCVSKLTGLGNAKVDIITANGKRDESQSSSSFTVTSSRSNSGLSQGAIAGIIVGAICGLIILVAIIGIVVYTMMKPSKETRV